MATRPLARVGFCAAVLLSLSTPLHAQLAPGIQIQYVGDDQQTHPGLPPEVLIGEDLRFQLLVSPAPSTGYGPFVEIYFQYGGADGTAAPAHCDGLHFTQAAARFATTVLPLPSCPATTSFVFPLPSQCPGTDVNTPLCFFGAAPPSCAGESAAGFQKVVIELPFGSFVPGQPPVLVNVTAKVDSFADLGAPLTVKARGGFRFGPFAAGGTSTIDKTCPIATSASTTPVLARIKKVYSGREDETATGPNFPRSYDLLVDVADGQVLSPLTIVDCLPTNLQFDGVGPLPPGCNGFGFPTSLCPNDGFEVDCPAVTGTAAPVDLAMTFDFEIPEQDLFSVDEVLGPSCSAQSIDDVKVEATWQPLDPRDAQGAFTSDLTPADHTLADRCVAVQKGWDFAAGGPEATPGDTVRYTLDFQVSDFRTMGGIVIDDLLSDGQSLVPGSASLTIGDKFGGPVSGPFTPSTLVPSTIIGQVTCADGSTMVRPTRLRFLVSSLLQLLDASNPRHAQGILTGGLAGLPNLTPLGGATGRITFLAHLDDKFQRQGPKREPFVDKDDTLLDCAEIRGEVLANLDAPAVPSTVTGAGNDTTVQKVTIAHDVLKKRVYAINGSPVGPGPVQVNPGDDVTFQIEYRIPSSDAEKLVFEDFLPLPVFSAAGFGFGVCAPSLPPAQTASVIGSFCTAPNGPPSFFPSPAKNSLQFSFGNVQDQANQPATVDLRVTAKVTSNPYEDGLQLANHVLEQESNTFGLQVAETEIAPIVVGEPRLRIRKGVVATSKALAAYSPTTTAPAGVVFFPPGTPGPAFTGVIDSTNVVDLGNVVAALNSNVSHVDACDFVRYAIVVENTGSSAHGAFDVRISDLFPSCLTGFSNLQVVDGQGAPFTCNGGKQCSSLGGAFLGPGITLDDAPTGGSLAPFSPTAGDNLAIITFDARLPCKGTTAGCCTNTAKIRNYAGVEQGPNHLPANFSLPFPGTTPDPQSAFTDTALACVQPILTKTIVSTSNADTAASSTTADLAIGEVVRYELETVLPEGTSPQMKIVDQLPAGLMWLAPSCTFTPAAGSDPQISFGVPTPTFQLTNSQSRLTLSLGTVVNLHNDPADEVLTVECDALVLNDLGLNVKPKTKPNQFSVIVGHTTFTSPPVVATIVEPSGGLAKQELPSTLPASATFRLTYTNGGTAPAYDVRVRDVLPPGLVVGPIVAVPATCTVVSAASPIEVACPSVPVNGTVTVDVAVTGIALCHPYPDHATLEYTSLPGPTDRPIDERVYSSAADLVTLHCPDLALTKTHIGDFTPGAFGTYTLTVTNVGNAPTVPPETVSDTLPGGLSFVSGGGNGWSCSAVSSAVTCTNPLPIPPGASSSFTIIVTVPCGLAAVVNCAAVSLQPELNVANNRSCDPTKVVLGTPVGSCVIAIGAGSAHSLVVRSDRTGLAWGANGGQLGDGGTADQKAPVAIQGLSGIAALTGGANHTLGLLQNGTVWAWGRNDLGGALGDGTFVNTTLPVQVKGPGGSGFLTGAVAIAAGGYHSLALLGDGHVLAWGYNQSGQLGDGTTTSSNVPLQVPGLSGVVAIAAGYEYSLALLADGSVRAWGANLVGQLGNGTNVASTVPVAVLAVSGSGTLSGVEAIAAGDFHALALLADSSVLAWGSGQSGQLGNGGTTLSKLPVPVLGVGGTGKLSGVIGVAGGGEHSLALLSGGTAVAWGLGGEGQLGNGSSNNSSAPVAISALSGITALAAGSSHSLALLTDGSIRVWGFNNSGQLGDGTTTSSNVPKQVTIVCPRCVTPPRGLVGWWPFDEPAGPTAVDLAGAVHNDGTHVGAPAPEAGKVAGALCLGGNGDYVQVPDQAETDLGTGDLTIDLWLRTTAQGTLTILDKRQGSPDLRGYSLFLSAGRPGLQLADRAGSTICTASPNASCTNWVATTASIADGAWHHVAVTVVRGQASGGTFYVDGSAVGTFDPTSRTQSVDNTADLWLGANHAVAGGSVSYFPGCLDEVEIVKRALTADEVGAIYRAGALGKCKCRPDAAIAKTHAGNFAAGQPGTYLLTVTNGGTAPATPPVVVTDVLPFPLSFQSGGNNDWSCSAVGAVVTCVSTTAIPAGGSSSFPLIVLVGDTTAGPVDNCATVAATAGDFGPDNNHVCDPTHFACVPVTAGDVSCFDPFFPFFPFRVCSYTALADLGGPLGTTLDSVTSTQGLVGPATISGSSNPMTISGAFVTTLLGSVPFCLDFHFSEQGRFFCQTEVCYTLPP